MDVNLFNSVLKMVSTVCGSSIAEFWSPIGDFVVVCPVIPMPITDMVSLTLKAVMGMNRDDVQMMLGIY